MQRPYDLKYERKLTNAVSWPCWKGNIREWMSSLAVFWKEPIWIELQRCWPHIRVPVKSKSRNSNRSSFGSCVPIWKAILSYVKLRAYKQNLLLKLSQSSNSKTATTTKQTNPQLAARIKLCSGKIVGHLEVSNFSLSKWQLRLQCKAFHMKIRGCPHLVLGNQYTGSSTKWCCVHTLSTRHVSVYIVTSYRPARRHFETRA